MDSFRAKFGYFVCLCLFFSHLSYGSAAMSTLSLKQNPFTYSGVYTDSESGLEYLQARYYAPRLMRFLQRDTYSLMNHYAYGNSNPIMEDDPTGHLPTVNLISGISGILMSVGMVSLFFTGGLDIGALAVLGFFSEGIMNSISDFDTRLSEKASTDLMIATTATDLVSDAIDAPLTIYTGVAASAKGTEAGLLSLRFFTDVNPAANDILTLSTLNSNNPQYKTAELSLSIINQILGLAHYAGRAYGEGGALRAKSVQADTNYSTSMEDARTTRQNKIKDILDTTNENENEKVKIKNDAEEKFNATYTKNTTAYYQNTQQLIQGFETLFVKRGSLMGWRLFSLTSSSIQLKTNIKLLHTGSY